MGVDRLIYFGPYIKLERNEFVLERTINSCSNSQCEEYCTVIDGATKKFCTKCGNMIMPRKVMRKQKFTQNELDEIFEDYSYMQENFRDYLDDKEYMYLVPNKKSCRVYNVIPDEFDIDVDIIENILPENISKDLEEFKEKNKQYFEILGKKFPNYEINYGWLQTYN